MSECMMPDCQNQSAVPVCGECAKTMPPQEVLIVTIRENIRSLVHFEMIDQKNGIDNESYVANLAKMELFFEEYFEGRLSSLIERVKASFKKV